MWPNLCLVLYGAIQGSAGWFLDPVFLLKFWHLHPAFGICMGLGQSCKMSMHKSSQNWLVFAKFLVLPNFLPQETNCFTVISVTFCNSGLGLFLFWDILLYRLSFFLQNWSFSSMSPRVAKGRQGLPRVSKVPGGPQGWMRWVITRSVIFKSFSYMIFKIGPFPHWNSPQKRKWLVSYRLWKTAAGDTPSTPGVVWRRVLPLTT